MNPEDNDLGGDDIFSAMNSEFPPIDSDGTTDPVDDGGSSFAPNNEPKEDKPNESKPSESDQVSDDTNLDEADDFFNDDDSSNNDEFSEESFDKETETLSQGMDKKASDKFKELRNELKQFKQKTKEVSVPEDVQAKLKDLEIKAAEAEGLRQQVEELSSVSAKVKVEQSKEYKERILVPVMEILTEADAIAEKHGIESDVIQAIIREQDKETQVGLIHSHLSDLNELEKQDVYRMIFDFKNLSKAREEMLADASSKLSQLEAEQIAEQNRIAAEEKKAVQEIQVSIWDKYKEIIPGFVNEDGEPTEDWNKLRNRALSIDFSKAAGKDKAYAAFAGVALPHVIKELNHAKKMLKEYSGKEANELLRRPKLGQAPVSENNDDTDFLSLMRKTKFK
jgi:hypothetical protein